MLTARAQKETIEAVSGLRFRTNARHDTAAGRQLQEIQSELSGGRGSLSLPTTLPHLTFFAVATADGPTNSYISLWVPQEQERQATELLNAAGFTVT